MMGRKSHESFVCSCGERCQMIPHEKTGRLAPIEDRLDDGGNVVLVPGDDQAGSSVYRVLGTPEARTANAGRLRFPHWARCKDADRFRR